MEEKMSDMLGLPGVEQSAAPNPEPAQVADVQHPEGGETQEQKAARERDELGRFKAKEAAETQATEPAKPKNTPEQDAAFAAMRRELDELKRGQQQPQQPERVPQTQEEVAIVNHLNASEERTTALLSMQLGDPDQATRMVDAAKKYFRQLDPQTQQQIIHSSEPYAALLLKYQQAYSEYQRQQSAQAYLAKLQELEFPTDDPAKIDEWALNYARKLAASQQAAKPQQSTQPPPPRSIASAPSAGGVGHVPSGPGIAFDSVFGN